MDYRILILLIIILIIINTILNLYSINIEYFNTELIINQHPAGFFSNFNKLITNLTDNPNITKITFNMISNSNKNNDFSYLEENTELFSKLFYIYDESFEITNKIIVKDFINSRITGREAYQYYNENRIKLQPFHDSYIKYIKIKPEIQSKISYHISKFFLLRNTVETVGILVRSKKLAGEQPSRKMPTRDDYDKAIESISKNNNFKYFLCIDNNDDLEYYKNKYKPNYYIDINRADNNKKDAPHSSKKEKPYDELENVFIQVCVLSHCTKLVHCVSNMATASLYMNMNQQSICVSK